MNANIRNLTGQRFGRLTILQLESTDKIGKTFWRCLCDCGKECVLERRELVRKDTRARKTCGCRGYSGIVPGFFWSFFIVVTRRRKGERFKDVEISYEYVCSIFEQQCGRCAISGVPLKFGSTKETQFTGTNASLDRKDSSLGYVPGNVQFVHKIVNIMKNKLSDDEFIEWCKIIAHHNSQTQELAA